MKNFIIRFLKQNKGNVLMTVALISGVLLAVMAAESDYGRAELAKIKLQNIADIAIASTNKLDNTATTAQITTQANKYKNVNLPNSNWTMTSLNSTMALTVTHPDPNHRVVTAPAWGGQMQAMMSTFTKGQKQVQINVGSNDAICVTGPTGVTDNSKPCPSKTVGNITSIQSYDCKTKVYSWTDDYSSCHFTECLSVAACGTPKETLYYQNGTDVTESCYPTYDNQALQTGSGPSWTYTDVITGQKSSGWYWKAGGAASTSKTAVPQCQQGTDALCVLWGPSSPNGSTDVDRLELRLNDSGNCGPPPYNCGTPLYISSANNACHTVTCKSSGCITCSGRAPNGCNAD